MTGGKETVKKKILLTGKNNSIIDDVFNHMTAHFIPMYSSLRYADMELHVEIFQPDLFVICLNGETNGELARFTEIKRKLKRAGILTVVIGSVEECTNFDRTVINFTDLYIQKPKNDEHIKDSILDLIKEKEAEKVKIEEHEKEKAEIAEAHRRKHVLVIDDDPMMLKVIKELLHEKYDVATAINGKIARKFLENKSTDLILLDYEMPEENGPDVYEKIRAMEGMAEKPILFLTGVSDKEKIKQVLILKPQGYILKPIDSEKFMATVGSFLG